MGGGEDLLRLEKYWGICIVEESERERESEILLSSAVLRIFAGGNQFH